MERSLRPSCMHLPQRRPLGGLATAAQGTSERGSVDRSAAAHWGGQDADPGPAGNDLQTNPPRVSVSGRTLRPECPGDAEAEGRAGPTSQECPPRSLAVVSAPPPSTFKSSWLAVRCSSLQ